MEQMDWFELWFADRKGIAETMRRNMASDLDAGYDPNGISIMRQKVAIADYEAETDRQMDRFKTMEDKAVNRWCYYELKKRGAI